MNRIERYWHKQVEALSARSLRIFGAILIALLVYLGCRSVEAIRIFYFVPIALPLVGMLWLPLLRFCYADLMLLSFPVGYLVSSLVI